MEVDIIVRSWWSYVLRGMLALVFGVLFMAYPGKTLKAFVILLGIFFIIDGAVNLGRSAALAVRKGPWGLTLAWGLIGLLIGVLLLNHSEFTLAFTAVLAGMWVIIMGIAEVAVAIDMPPHSGRGFLAVLGMISLGFGIAILTWTASTVYALMVLLGIYLLAVAAMDMLIGIYVGRMQRALKRELK